MSYAAVPRGHSQRSFAPLRGLRTAARFFATLRVLKIDRSQFRKVRAWTADRTLVQRPCRSHPLVGLPSRLPCLLGLIGRTPENYHRLGPRERPGLGSEPLPLRQLLQP